MEILIQTPHFKASDILRAFVNEKVNKLSHLNNRIIRTEVWLKLDKSDTDENKVCEVKLIVRGKELFAERRCHTFEEAIVNVVDALQEQIRKQKVY